jgi:dienelactone hydrolase
VKLKLQFFALFLPAFISVGAQTRVNFSSGDGLNVVADKYFVNDTLPWILMFHQSGSSRGEFREIAPKLIRLGYNALAVDLRHGKEINYVPNETSIAAQVKNLPRTMTDARMDMLAAMEWVKGQSDKPFILFGSSYSASLAMILARDNPVTSAVVAFSPGEFFGAPNLVRNAVRNLDVPVFLASTRREYPYITELSSGIGTIIK